MGDFPNHPTSSLADASRTAFGQFKSHFSNNESNTEVRLLSIFRDVHPDQRITVVPINSATLLAFAAAGKAEANPVIETGDHITEIKYTPPPTRTYPGDGEVEDDIKFAFFDYIYDDHRFGLYVVHMCKPDGLFSKQYLVHPKDSDSYTRCCEKLLKDAGKWSKALHDQIYVFDQGGWSKSKKLWEAVQSSQWEDVVLEPSMKDSLIRDIEGFFDSRSTYEEYGVTWKRGIIFHGTPGCGKTISIKASMNWLQSRDVASLYVKSFSSQRMPKQHAVRNIFTLARNMAPCMLIFEDLDSLIVEEVRSYFLNEIDGLEDNSGMLIIGSTNHLDRLDPAIAKRPSRFDRKYHFNLPGERERILYSEYWRKKILKTGKINFPEDASKVIAQATEGFSFAYLKELFVQTLLAIAGGRADIDDDDGEADETKKDDKKDESKRDVEAQKSGSANGASNAVEALKAKIPEVEIPDHLKENLMLRTLIKQNKALRREMDNTNSDEIHSRQKIA